MDRLNTIGSRLQIGLKMFVGCTHLQSYLLYGGSLVIGLNFIVPGLEWSILVGLLPFIYYLHNIYKVNKKRALLDFYLSGLVISLFAYSFFLSIEPANWQFLVSGWFSSYAVVSAWMITSMFTSLGFMLLPLMGFWIKKPDYRLLAFPFLWVACEIVNGWFFSVISYGPGGSIGYQNNFAGICSIASSTSMVFSSRLLGFYGLSLIVCFGALAVYLVAIRKQYIFAGTLFAIFLLVVGLGYGIDLNKQTSGLSKINMAAIHLNEQDTMANPANVDSLPKDIDLLVLPEYSELQQNNRYQQVLGKLSDRGLIVTTKLEGKSPDAQNILVFIDKTGTEVYSVAKRRLVPGGEYLPYVTSSLFSLIGKQEYNDLYKYSYKLEPGNTPIRNFEDKSISYGALPCSGVITTASYKQLVDNGADILLNPASLSLLKSESNYHLLAKRMAVFQAVRNARPFIQASRSGQSYVINSKGYTLSASQGQDTQVLEFSLAL